MEIFDEVVSDIASGSLSLGDSETRENTWSISLTSGHAQSVSAVDVASFLDRAREAYAGLAANDSVTGLLRFYAWVDEQAGQLRFSVSSSDPLPFGASIRLVSDALVIPRQFLASPHLEGLAWSEFEPFESNQVLDDEHEPIEVLLDVYVVPLLGPSLSQSATTVV